jgi:UDP-N-acetylmuramoyl-tripeptide--D-alanyl-D-alanine ligase
MESLKIIEITKAVGGKLINCSEDLNIYSISTDSRKISKGDLFIALSGENFDGHKFVDASIKDGAIAALVSKEINVNCPQIIVDDTMKALKSLASYYRSKFEFPIVAVTGSTGKTSTKEMISSVLEEKFSVHKTQKNFNNEIGLPLSIFNMESNHQISILEMGMNNLGEIKRLADIARPSVGVITNIGTAHIENLGTRENIMKAKMEITTYFDEKCTLIVNGDDEYLSSIANKPYKVIKTSLYGKGDYNAFSINNLGEEGVEFVANYRGDNHLFRINVPGTHNVYNALAAIAIGDIFNLSLEEIKEGILKFKPVGSRMNIISLENDIKIIDDCYNANPESMKASINVLSSFNERRRIAVLGDMFELGEFSEEAHREVGKHLRGRCDLVVTVGESSRYIFEESKVDINSRHFNTKEDACLYINSIIKEKDVLLIKASRGMKMEDITNSIIEDRKRGK